MNKKGGRAGSTPPSESVRISEPKPSTLPVTFPVTLPLTTKAALQQAALSPDIQLQPVVQKLPVATLDGNRDNKLLYNPAG